MAALTDAALTIARGEVHALIGQNGAGKSTLIKVLTGDHRRDAGEIMLEGGPFEVGSPHEAQRRGISTIYQEINLVPLRSVTENICLAGERGASACSTGKPCTPRPNGCRASRPN